MMHVHVTGCDTPGCGGFDVSACCPAGLALHEVVCRSLAADLCNGPPDELVAWPPEIVPAPETLAIIWLTVQRIARIVIPNYPPSLSENEEWAIVIAASRYHPGWVWEASVRLGRRIHTITAEDER